MTDVDQALVDDRRKRKREYQREYQRERRKAAKEGQHE